MNIVIRMKDFKEIREYIAKRPYVKQMDLLTLKKRYRETFPQLSKEQVDSCINKYCRPRVIEFRASGNCITGICQYGVYKLYINNMERCYLEEGTKSEYKVEHQCNLRLECQNGFTVGKTLSLYDIETTTSGIQLGNGVNVLPDIPMFEDYNTTTGIALLKGKLVAVESAQFSKPIYCIEHRTKDNKTLKVKAYFAFGDTRYVSPIVGSNMNLYINDKNYDKEQGCYTCHINDICSL